MNATQLIAQVKCGIESGKRVFVTRHIVGRIGPVFEAKPLGFGTGNVMLRIGSQRDWVSVDPGMCNVTFE